MSGKPKLDGPGGSEKNLRIAIIKLIRNLDNKTLVVWATDCAEHVLPYFEEKYPKDDRPRKAIETARAWAQGKATVGEARTAAFASHAAARDTDRGAARAAARSAGQAAATVHVPDHAIHAANYAATINSTERAWQYQHLLEIRKFRNKN